MKKIISIFLALSLVIVSAISVFAGGEGISRTIFGNDDRYTVTSTSGKNLSIAKLKITYNDGSVGYGTGFLLSSTKVATAGHCLSIEKSNGTVKAATKVVLYFGCSGTNSNHTYSGSRTVNCTSSNTITSSNWDGSLSNSDYDYGVIILPTAFNNNGNYFTLSTNSNPTGINASIIGYEHHLLNTDFSNWQLLRGDGTISGYTSYKLETHIDALQGQSGSPVIDGNGNVIGIYTYGANDGSNFLGDNSSYLNKATRITDDVISFYNNH